MSVRGEVDARMRLLPDGMTRGVIQAHNLEAE